MSSYSYVQMINDVQMIVDTYVQKINGIQMSCNSCVQMIMNESLPIKPEAQRIFLRCHHTRKNYGGKIKIS